MRNISDESCRENQNTFCVEYIYIYIYKGKAIPLQAWRAPEVSRRLRLPDFKKVGT